MKRSADAVSRETMSRELPDISLVVFSERLRALSPEPLKAETLAVLYQHYRQLRLWNQRLSLIGPGTVDEVLSRHYGESLAALPWITGNDTVLVDVGSGAGFPGFVLAAGRPGANVFLVEARQRKWSFLKSVVRRGHALTPEPPSDAASLSCSCINARIERSLPGELPPQIDVVTSRAVGISPELAALFVRRSPEVRFILWTGERRSKTLPGFEVQKLHQLSGSDRRWLVEITYSG